MLSQKLKLGLQGYLVSINLVLTIIQYEILTLGKKYITIEVKEM